MIVLNRNELVGDGLSTLPAIWALAQNNHIYLASENFEIGCLLPETDNITHLKNLDELLKITTLIDEKIYILDAGKNFALHCSAGYHMSQGHFRFLGLPMPSEIPGVPLRIEPKEVEAYDFIISPYSRSDNNNNKFWPIDKWQEIVTWLINKNYTVATLGSGRHEEEVLPNVTHHIHGRSLNEVANYLLRTKKAVLSIDNGLSHMSRLLNVPHFLLYPMCLPPNWVSNPNAKSLRGNPLDISVDQVKQFLQTSYAL